MEYRFEFQGGICGNNTTYAWPQVCVKSELISWIFNLKFPGVYFQRISAFTLSSVSLEKQTTKYLSRSLPYHWNFKHFSRYQLDNGKEDSFYQYARGWCPTVQVPHTPLCRVAAKNRAIYSSWVSQQDRQHKNSIQTSASNRVVHRILVVYCLSPCVAVSLTAVNLNPLSVHSEKVVWTGQLDGPSWSRLVAALQNSHDSR